MLGSRDRGSHVCAALVFPGTTKSVMLHDESRFSLCCPSVEDEVYGVAFPSMEKQCFSPVEDISMRRVIKIRFYDQ